MPNFVGFDTDAFPGLNVMAALKASNLSFVGYYLAPAPAHHDTGWMGKRAALVTQGWGLLPIYVGRQLNEKLSGGGKVINVSAPTSDGAADGQEAAMLMQAEGFPAGSHVYLDLENGPPLTAVQRMYVQAWCSAVKRFGYAPSVYCSHLLADSISAVVPGTRIWSVKVSTVDYHELDCGATFPIPDPHASGYSYAFVWQFEQNAGIIHGLTVDLSSSVNRDPSAP